MIMAITCPCCGHEMKEEDPPHSAMGEPMYGRYVENYYCDNTRCPRFGI